ncbi:glycoside hydrolase family 88 protein [Echinicola jeungdonensis]|uniref:Glycoside hydrolase family 105 protein n=1 Tax=Echinicola jeungdonensis TaxID=709343 RepID=A0ABV5J9M3_9BACT|nr:glycoside hydrolase family 88 protein [Echinicola jeungdonensis]MDN3670378.1 glycoside hydrolase family 88 protein [Echinicola jeungdonensis]
MNSIYKFPRTSRKGRTISILAFICFLFSFSLFAQEKQTDSNTPLHLIQPDYAVPYGKVSPKSVESVLGKINSYLEDKTPVTLKDKSSGETISDLSHFASEVELVDGDFRLFSYEWGVTYAGMLAAFEATGDEKYKDYTDKRLTFLSNLYSHQIQKVKDNSSYQSPIPKVMHPHALDDAGALCAALIKAQKAGVEADFNPIIDDFIDFIINKQFRLEDGTLARNRPLTHTLWLDDLFMSVPALAQMGSKTGDSKYFDEAVKQVLAFSDRMFNEEKGIYMHGWVEGVEHFPQFHWGRANGWAFMTLVELLDVLPENHPGREQVMAYFTGHAKGLVSYQSNTGLWHQLLDRNDSYLETSASAIYTYAFAKAINKGWLDYRVFGPLTLLAWSGVAEQVNDAGQVKGTCVGTGMGFDPAFYYHRPVSVYAAHGYGPVLLAGAEVIKLLQNHPYHIDETAVQFLVEK